MLPAVVSVASPPRAGLLRRLNVLTRHPELSAALLALLIGFASVFSAVIAWRASLESIDASRYESQVVQQQARQQQIRRELEGIVEQDLRFVSTYQEHALAAREMRAQADAVRDTDPDVADALDLEAQSRLALARAIQPFFLGASGIELGTDGTVAYDRAYVLRNLEASNVELRELRTLPTVELERRADAREISFIGVGAIVVTALFFLTVAQVSRTRVLVRQLFFGAGAVLVLAGMVGFVLVEALG